MAIPKLGSVSKSINKKAKAPLSIGKKTSKSVPETEQLKKPVSASKKAKTYQELNKAVQKDQSRQRDVLKRPAKTYEKQIPLAKRRSFPHTNNTAPLSAIEAQEAIKSLKKNGKSQMGICYALAVRKGFEVLGHKSFKECLEKENVGVEYAYAHKLKTAGEIHMVVCPKIPMGNISEGVLRPLHKFPDDDKKLIWKHAVNKCEKSTEVTITIIEEVIKTGGFDKKSTRTKAPIEIEVSQALTSALQKSAFDLIKNHNLIKRKAPVTKTNFNKALGLLFNEVRSYVSERYEKLHE